MKDRSGSILTYFLILISALLYGWFSVEVRQNTFGLLLFIYALLFGAYFIIISQSIHRVQFWILIAVAFLFRLVFIIDVPSLTTDFYRFIWDGRLIFAGINPFDYTPDEISEMGLLERIAESHLLIPGMGSLSASNPTCYPPLNQLIFYLSVMFFPESFKGSIIIMRLFILFSEAGITLLTIRILKSMGEHPSKVFFYLLNPLVIIELTGNLHFEAVMIFFLLASVYSLMKKKWILSAILLSLSISVKLITLLFIPLLIRKLGLQKGIYFTVIVLLLNLIFFLPFFSKTGIEHFFESLRLFIQTFEFNAGIYFLARSLGYLITGYNQIAIIGPVLSVLTFFVIIYISIRNAQLSYEGLFQSMAVIIMVYFIFATTVHPWYICTIMAISVFTKYRSPMVWTALVILSYSFYDPVHNPWYYHLVGVEYILLIGFLVWELINKKNSSLLMYNRTT